MFTDKEARESIEKFSKETDYKISGILNSCLAIQKGQDRVEESVDQKIEMLKIDVQRELVKFHKELTDRYFDTLERILRVHSESSLVTALAHQVNEKDLNNLKSSLLQPFLEAKWAKDKQEKGQNILNKGEVIIAEWERLHEEIITKERNGADVSKEKIQWAVLDKIVSEIGQ